MGCPRCGSVHVSASGRCAKCGALDSSSVTVLTPAAAVPAAVPFLRPIPLPKPRSLIQFRTLLPSGPNGRSCADSVPCPPARPLEPRYHIIRALGAGGMGVVYQAWDAELGVAVALKVIRPEVLLDPGSAGEVERRFKRELVLATAGHTQARRPHSRSRRAERYQVPDDAVRRG